MHSPEESSKSESKTSITRKTWDEFRDTGLLWWVNSLLHLFGWTIVMEMDSQKTIKICFPARTSYRGFPADSNDRGYRKVTNYMVQNSEELLKAFTEDKEGEQ